VVRSPGERRGPRRGRRRQGRAHRSPRPLDPYPRPCGPLRRRRGRGPPAAGRAGPGRRCGAPATASAEPVRRGRAAGHTAGVRRHRALRPGPAPRAATANRPTERSREPLCWGLPRSACQGDRPGV